MNIFSKALVIMFDINFYRLMEKIIFIDMKHYLKLIQINYNYAFLSTIYERISRLWITVRSALLRLPALHSTVGSELLSQRNFHTRQPSNERSSSNKFQTQPLCFAQTCVLTTSRAMVKVDKIQNAFSRKLKLYTKELYGTLRKIIRKI